MRQRIIIYSFIYLFAILLFSGCAGKNSSPTEIKISQNSDEAKKMLVQAQTLYGDGVIYNMRGEWTKARDSFDSALKIISNLDLEYCDNVSDDIDALLREIAYDYRFTLSQSETLNVESAPVVLSLALSEAPFSELTKKRLHQLMDELPTDTISISHDYPIVINDRVKEKIIFFQNEAKKPMTKWLARSHKYLPMIKEVFAKEGIPQDLAYLPLIESGFNPNAYSWAHAVGVWQFIKGTAKNYGLNVSWWVDERRDPDKSTYAAAKYLKRLHDIFDDWYLALAAYNCGEGRVQRNMAKQKIDNYWDLDLPTQTENYVPLFIAALLIAKEPEKYGFEKNEPEKQIDYDIVYVTEVVDLKLAARCSNTTFDTLKMLNPELVRACTPPKVSKYPLRVPKNKGKLFVEKYKKIPESEKIAWARHKVRKGESLWTIARRYNTSVQALIDANSIRNPKMLKPGKYLIIPTSRGKVPSNSYAKNNSKSKTSYKTYTVKSGDTPSQIAEKFKISTSKLLSSNKLNKNSVIKTGQKLKIPCVIVSSKSPKNTKSEPTTHIVRNGESLWLVARKYGVTVVNIKKWNSLKSDRLKPGQKLIVYGNSSSSSSTTVVSSKKRNKKTTHKVKNGESLWSIAKKYGVSVSNITSWNKLKSNKLSIGQKLVIYRDVDEKIAMNSESRKVVHTVLKGETLWKIARRYGTNTNTIIQQNNITDPAKLKPGDKLKIIIQ
ncbi:LysM peptidoglycan-binding domain-containing protein [bacterium]|nr:LysM peptidoglycan-binding domain-containing protein [bacterium]